MSAFGGKADVNGGKADIIPAGVDLSTRGSGGADVGLSVNQHEAAITKAVSSFRMIEKGTRVEILADCGASAGEIASAFDGLDGNVRIRPSRSVRRPN